MPQFIHLKDAGVSVKRYDTSKDIVIRDNNDGHMVLIPEDGLPELVEFLSRFL